MGAINELFLYVVVESDGEEHLLGMRDDDTWVALIGEDAAHAERLEPIARRMGMELKRDVKLIKFSAREEVSL